MSEMWEVKSLLIACSQLHGRNTGENIVSEFEEIVTCLKISDKVYKVVTDNASNVKKAFADTVSMPSFEVEAESEESEQEDEDIEETDGSDAEVEAIELEKMTIPQRVSCFAHTLQLTVKDGLKACSGISKVLTKAARIVNHVKKSTVATEKIERLYGKTLVSKNETRWNSQLKMVRRLFEIDVDKVVDRRELHLNAYEKLVLRELVEVLEPFEEATDILQGEKYNSISLVIPSFLGLKDHISRLNTLHCAQLVTTMQSSLDCRLGHLLDDPLYICGASLDHRFKLKWSKNVDEHKKVLQEEVSMLSQLDSSESFSEDEPPAPKRSKLFSFMAVPGKVHKKRRKRYNCT